VFQRIVVPMLLTLVTSVLSAQSEAALKEYFEGRMVTPKLAMPGTEDGVDVYPGSARPLDYSRYASRELDPLADKVADELRQEDVK